MTAWRRAVGKEGIQGCRKGGSVECARDENRGAGFRTENEMELNDS